MSTPEQHFDAARRFQEFYDATLRKIGARAPQPILGETVNHYRRETLRNLKRTFFRRTTISIKCSIVSCANFPGSVSRFLGRASYSNSAR
jgi:hypothetical protein